MLKGKVYWARSLAASSLGEAVDTVVFSVIAFAGTMPGGDLFRLILTVYAIKLLFELLAIPFSAALVRRMKRNEKVDVYDTDGSYAFLERTTTK